MLSVNDVAKYILSKKGSMPAMKLQKLVYYCQAWSLVWDDAQLFREPIEAWANNPVCRVLFELHKGKFEISDLPEGESKKLSDTQKETIDKVLDFYGDRTSQWLSDLTHMEDPWINARKRGNLSDGERGNEEITLDDMLQYYSSINTNHSF